MQLSFNKENVDRIVVDKYPESCHVYGGMSAVGLTDLIFVNGTITSSKYVNEILQSLCIDHQKRKKKSQSK